MRRPLRNTILICVSLLSLSVVITGTLALRGIGGVSGALDRLRSQIAATSDAERVALEAHRTFHAIQGTLAGDAEAAEALEARRSALHVALRSLGSHPVDPLAGSVPGEAAFEALDRYAQRTIELVGSGQRDAAKQLLREDVPVLIEHRFLDPLAGRLSSLDETGVRAFDRTLSGAAQHWALAPLLGESVRNALLARSVETVLVLRLAREAAQEMARLGSTGADSPPDGSLRSWDRLQRVARIAPEPRAVAPAIAKHFGAWRSAFEDASAGSERLDVAWHRFEVGLAPAADRYAVAVAGEVEASLLVLDDRLAALRAWLLAWIGVAVLLAALAPIWLARHFSGPLRRIREWSESVRRGESDHALPETTSDEIGAVTESLREMASTFADLHERAETLAFYDGVTGLPNRQLLQERLQSSLVWAQINRRMVGLLTLSLSSFKEINDAHGHDVGDRLLREVADRLAHGVRLGDLVARPGGETPLAHLARLGGAEFTLMLADIQDANDAGRVAFRILAKMSEPFDIDGEQLFANPSIGISIFPIDGTEASQLIAHANVAAHHARIAPNSQFQFYSQAMNAAAARKLLVGGRLRGAVERDELTFHLQPIRDARTGLVSGAEVLLRWDDPELGPVPPSEFVLVAEEIGLIGQIGDWVVRAACKQAQSWREQGFAPIRFAVNASPQQLRDEGWADRVADILRETGTSVDQLEVEITESSILHDDGTTVATLTRFREMGIGIALDDFGTGYSSLSYLRRFPIGRVKIDRSFVAEIGTEDDGTRLTAAMLAMAQSLRLKVVAEGIETIDQANFLCERGCDELQGFLFSRPVPAESFVPFLEREKDAQEGVG